MLLLNVVLSCEGKGKLQTRWFEGGQIVLLALTLDLRVNREKKLLVEIGDEGAAIVDADAAALGLNLVAPGSSGGGGSGDGGETRVEAAGGEGLAARQVYGEDVG